jgi:hypothetical protein
MSPDMSITPAPLTPTIGGHAPHTPDEVQASPQSSSAARIRCSRSSAIQRRVPGRDRGTLPAGCRLSITCRLLLGDRKAPAGTGRDAVPARGIRASPAPRYATRPPPTLPPGRALRRRGGNGEQGRAAGRRTASAGRSSLQSGPRTSRESDCPPFRGRTARAVKLASTQGAVRRATRFGRSSHTSRPCVAATRDHAGQLGLGTAHPGHQLGRVPVGMCGWLRARSAVASGRHHCRGPEQRKRHQSFRKIPVMATGR